MLIMHAWVVLEVRPVHGLPAVAGPQLGNPAAKKRDGDRLVPHCAAAPPACVPLPLKGFFRWKATAMKHMAAFLIGIAKASYW